MGQQQDRLLPAGNGIMLPPANTAVSAEVGWGDRIQAAPLQTADSEDYLSLIWKHKIALVLYALICGAAAYYLSKLQSPMYRAATLVEIQNVNNRAVSLEGPDAGGAGIDPGGAPSDGYVQNQVEVLGSATLIARVATKLRLNEKQEFSGVESGLLDRLRPARKPGAAAASIDTAVEIAQQRLKILPVRGSGIVRMEFTSADPALAATFLNTLTNESIDQGMELRMNSAQRMSEFFTRQLTDIEQRLKQSENSLQAFAKASGLSADPSKRSETANDVSLKRIREDLVNAQSDRMTKQAQHELVSQSSPDALPQVLESPTLRDYQAKLTELRRQAAELAVVLTPAHFKVKQITAQIAELDAMRNRERENILRRISNDYEVAKRNEQLLTAAYNRQEQVVAGQDDKSVRLSFLMKEVDTIRELHEVLQRKVREAGLAAAMRVRNVMVVDPAKPPTSPFSPKPMMNLALGLVSGLSSGIFFICVRGRSKRALKAPADSTMCLGVPALGVIPSEASALKLEGGQSKFLGLLRTNSRPRSIDLAPEGSIIAESYRSALASILFGEVGGRGAQVITFTSPDAQVGKSTSVCNLGAALARVRPPVLLIDGDLRRGRLHHVFSLANITGFHDLLTMNDFSDSIATAAQPTEVPGLFVLTKGSVCDSPSDVLHSAKLPALIETLRGKFSTILIDSPPAIELVDARLLAHQSDGVIMVCRSGETDRDSARTVVERLVQDGSRILGTILNHCDATASRYKYAYRRMANSD